MKTYIPKIKDRVRIISLKRNSNSSIFSPSFGRNAEAQQVWVLGRLKKYGCFINFFHRKPSYNRGISAKVTMPDSKLWRDIYDFKCIPWREEDKEIDIHIA